LSFNASVNVWLNVGSTKEALLGKYLIETVLASGGIDAPVNE
jgi:hypothetical protein